MVRRNVGKKNGFSLVELVVVVLILGIIAAVAAPKMFNTANDARDNASKQSLVVVRDAIELYKAQNGDYPSPAASLPTLLKPFLKGPFPVVQVGSNKNSTVITSSQNPITAPEAGTDGWVYNPTTGDISINDATYIGW